MNAYERGLLEAIENDMIIKDDLGMSWYWADGRIRLVLAEIEAPQDRDQNGYYCVNFKDAEKVLIDGGYITRPLDALLGVGDG